MALKIYPDAIGSSPYSQGSMLNSFREAFDGRVGEVKEVKLYLRNDDNTKTYSTVQLSVINSLGGRDLADGTDGYSCKLRAGEIQPSYDEWRSIDHANIITMSDILDIVTYLPFWVRIEIPKGAPVGSHENMVFRVTANES